MELIEYDYMDVLEAELWWYRALHARLLRALAPVRGRVLDAGCGTGGLLHALAATRPDLAAVGVEAEPRAASRARAKSGAPVARGSLNCLPFCPASFDAVVAADVLCHARVEPTAALASLQQALRPGGLLVVNMPAYRWLLSSHDRRVHNTRRMAARTLRRLLASAGFDAIDTRYWNGLLLPLMIAQRKFRMPPAAASDVRRVSPWLDPMFHAVTELERWLPFRLPAGGSVLATARRPMGAGAEDGCNADSRAR